MFRREGKNEPAGNSRSAEYGRRLFKLKEVYHSGCIFNLQPSIVPGLRVWFDNEGVLHGEFQCSANHQGFDQMVHGGVIAAIIDASMAQCLMGHDIVAYTTSLEIKYRKPVRINEVATVKTEITSIKKGLLHSVECKIEQKQLMAVTAEGNFYKIKQ